ncbi:hypothetical protein ACI77I_15455 [Pseudomonas sp. D47]|uniref:hypothetical protein n=1 Tax=Pseudomonas sp. D47 TaxID=3159447 RepID=UPI00387B87D7
MPEPRTLASHSQTPFGALKHIKAGLLDAAYAAVGVPTITLEGSGIGRNLPQEAPPAFAKAIVDADHL